jgi:tetratricopeptide (TPR) repeat protein
MDIFDRVIAAYPDYPEPWNKRATLNFIMGREAASLADIDRVLELEPRHFGALSGRGMIYRNQKKYSLAIEAFREALAINPALQTLKDAISEIERIERGI